MVEWNSGMDGVTNYNRIEYLCVTVVLRGQTLLSRRALLLSVQALAPKKSLGIFSVHLN